MKTQLQKQDEKRIDNVLQQMIVENKKVDKVLSKKRKSKQVYDKNKTLFIYTRVSTEEQTKGFSLESQRDIGEKLGKKLGLKTVLCNEKGKSSQHEELSKREVLMNLMNEVERGNVKYIYVFDLSRLSRNSNTSMYIRLQLYKHKCTLYTEKGEFNFDSIQDKLMFNVLSSFNEYENEMRRYRSVLGKIQSIKSGRWKGGMINFGYKLVDKMIEENKSESIHVKKMFDMYDSGKTTIDIQKYLHQEGILTRRGSELFSTGTIVSMLKNTIYLGYMNVEIEQQHFVLHTKQIISSEVFQRVQDRIDYSLRRRNQINKTTNFYLLRDFMYCKSCKNIICGRKVQRKNNIHGENYYYCSYSNYRWKKTGNKISKLCTMNRSVNIEKTDYLVWNTICDLFENSYYLKEQFKKQSLDNVYNSRTMLDKDIKLVERKIKDLDREINTIRENIIKVHTDHLSLKITLDERDKIIDSVQSEIKKRDDTKIELLTQIQDYVTEKSWLDWISKYKSKVKKMRQTKDQNVQRQIIESFLHKIELDYDHETKEHVLDIRLRMSLFNDKLKYKSTKNKKLGYDIIDGNKNKVIKFRRSKNVEEWIKKKGLEYTRIH